MIQKQSQSEAAGTRTPPLSSSIGNVLFGSAEISYSPLAKGMKQELKNFPPCTSEDVRLPEEDKNSCARAEQVLVVALEEGEQRSEVSQDDARAQGEK